MSNATSYNDTATTQFGLTLPMGLYSEIVQFAVKCNMDLNQAFEHLLNVGLSYANKEVQSQ